MDIEARGAEMAGLECVGECLLVDQAAASDIDEAGAAGEEGDDVRGQERPAGEVRRGGEEKAVRLRQHLVYARVKGRADGSFQLGALAQNVVVHDLHAKGGVGFARGAHADVAETDDAEGVRARVAGYGREVVVRGLELGWGEGTGGKKGGGGLAEDGDDMVDCHVADGFGGRTGAVAVEDAWKSQFGRWNCRMTE